MAGRCTRCRSSASSEAAAVTGRRCRRGAGRRADRADPGADAGPAGRRRAPAAPALALAGAAGGDGLRLRRRRRRGWRPSAGRRRRGRLRGRDHPVDPVAGAGAARAPAAQRRDRRAARRPRPADSGERRCRRCWSAGSSPCSSRARPASARRWRWPRRCWSGLGMPPLQAVVLALLGHAVGVSFGALGTPVLAQVALTGLDGVQIAWRTAALHAALGGADDGLLRAHAGRRRRRARLGLGGRRGGGLSGAQPAAGGHRSGRSWRRWARRCWARRVFVAALRRRRRQAHGRRPAWCARAGALRRAGRPGAGDARAGRRWPPPWARRASSGGLAASARACSRCATPARCCWPLADRRPPAARAAGRRRGGPGARRRASCCR